MYNGSPSKAIGFIAGPISFLLILLFSPESNGEMWKVLALAVWMISWWITDAIPIYATALLPIVILPLLNVSSVSEASAPYASPIIFLFMGGFLIALALEKHNLHQRIALNLIKLTGTSGNGIILGFMLATALLSMWISNTATTVMMLPIAVSVVNLLLQDDEMTQNERRFALGLMLGIAYAANIGGTMTLIGTPPNVVMAGYLSELVNYEMSFIDWLLIGLPIGSVLIGVTYLIITKLMFPNNMSAIKGSNMLIENKLSQLGELKREELSVLTVFLLTALCWILKPQINQLFGEKLLTDSITAMAGGLAMFVVPLDFKKNSFLINWSDTTKLPWGILILFGGGMALAKSLEKVGIIDLIGAWIATFDGLSLALLMLILTSIVLFLTELMSNVALITIFLPLVIGIANGTNTNPLLLVIPATMAASFAFMMPISTPPNAIVFASGYIKVRDMMKIGFILNIISILILLLAGMTLVPIILG